ncbi:MAG: hypothetical protein DCC68_20630 [Planctomycetota bacterium]|nr:MAG: hypothetical protein DCC68_20630 [Planctomycetota bacterium]
MKRWILMSAAAWVAVVGLALVEPAEQAQARLFGHGCHAGGHGRCHGGRHHRHHRTRCHGRCFGGNGCCGSYAGHACNGGYAGCHGGYGTCAGGYPVEHGAGYRDGGPPPAPPADAPPPAEAPRPADTPPTTAPPAGDAPPPAPQAGGNGESGAAAVAKATAGN